MRSLKEKLYGLIWLPIIAFASVFIFLLILVVSVLENITIWFYQKPIQLAESKEGITLHKNSATSCNELNPLCLEPQTGTTAYLLIKGGSIYTQEIDLNDKELSVIIRNIEQPKDIT